MKIRILHRDEFVSEVSDDQIEAYAKYALLQMKKRLKRIIPDVGIILVSEEEMKEMNMRFRAHNGSTDVLSFVSEEEGYLGDIVLAPEVIARYAHDNGCSFSEELQRDIVHGMLHLLGYDHEASLNENPLEPLFVIQEDIVSSYML